MNENCYTSNKHGPLHTIIKKKLYLISLHICASSPNHTLSLSLPLSFTFFLYIQQYYFCSVLFCFFEILSNKRIVFRLSQSLHVLRVLLIVLHNVCSAFLYFFFFFLLAVNYQTSLFYCCFVLLFVLFVC